MSIELFQVVLLVKDCGHFGVSLLTETGRGTRVSPKTTHPSTDSHTHTQRQICARTHAHTHTHTQRHEHDCMHMHMCKHTCTCTHTHTHTHTCVISWHVSFTAYTICHFMFQEGQEKEKKLRSWMNRERQKLAMHRPGLQEKPSCYHWILNRKSWIFVKALLYKKLFKKIKKQTWLHIRPSPEDFSQKDRI